MIKVYQLTLRQNNYTVGIPYKGVTVQVEFTKGNLFKGVPAQLVTNDAFKQRAIEHSVQFQNGTIRLDRTIEEAKDKVKTTAAKPRRTQHSQPPAASDEAATGTQPTGQGAEKKEFDNLGDAVMYVLDQWGEACSSEKEVRKAFDAHGIKVTIKKG